jgi:cytochrome b involved in lipid metabolism
MNQTNPLVYEDFIVIATSNEIRAGEWAGNFHISVNNTIIQEDVAKSLADSQDSAEHDAIIAAKEFIDEILKTGRIKIPYREYQLNMHVSQVKDGNEGERWHALMTIEGKNRGDSSGFVDVHPAGSFSLAVLKGFVAGQEGINGIK